MSSYSCRRIVVLAEGQTERKFVDAVLAPYFDSKGLDITASVILQNPRRSHQSNRGGIHSRAQILDNIRRFLLDPSIAVITTVIDYYRFPRSNQVETAEGIEHQLVKEVGDRRFIAYLQKHEFEAVLFSDIAIIETVLDLRQGTVAREVRSSPEDINSSPENHPCHILDRLCQTVHKRRYSKTTDGLEIARQTGLGPIRSRCPRFSRWIDDLEKACSK